MNKKIKITGRDIIGITGEDETGAFGELKFDFTPTYANGMCCIDPKVDKMEFEVDLEFIIRHDLMTKKIAEDHYNGTDEYLKYFNEGRDQFLSGGEENNPHNDPGENYNLRRYPWYHGFRQAKAAFIEDKYKISEFQKKVEDLVEEYGLKLQFTDEYLSPYAETPEGYWVDLAVERKRIN